MDEVVAEFAVEAAETLVGLQAGLAKLAAEPADRVAAGDMLHRLHGLKGACAFLGLPRAEALAHAGEAVLTAFAAAPSTVALAELGAMIQRLGELLDQAIRHRAEPEGDDAELIAALEAAANLRASLREAAEPAPPVLPVLPDFASSMTGDRRTPAPWAGLDSLARALGDSLGKRIEFAVGGDDVRIAREAVPGLRTALIALVRNACAHGVETAAERRAAAKPALAILRLSLHRSADGVALELADDGRGFDPEIEARAFEDGVSTAEALTRLAGRGLGLPLVRREVEALGGEVRVTSTPGRGARIVLALPASVMATPAARGRTAA